MVSGALIGCAVGMGILHPLSDEFYGGPRGGLGSALLLSSERTPPSCCSPVDGQDFLQHEVSRMDTLAGIAIKYGVEGVETRDQIHFITEENIERLKNAKEANRVQIDYTKYNYTQPISAPNNDNSRTGTVACVAVDATVSLAPATSIGGLVNKMAGRIGDTPVIGAGTYANALCAVSTTSKGEDIIRHTMACDVVAVMEHRGLPLEEAAARVVAGVPWGSMGLVAVSAAGEVTMAYNRTEMFRACATEDRHSEVAIWPA